MTLLEGLRVLDAGDFLAAPVAAMLLADWGADVIKIEPLRGDTVRTIGEIVSAPDMSAIFVSGNRGKRSVSVDLRSSGGRQLLMSLAEHCDVVLHNRTATQAALAGLDYPTLSSRRGDIVVGSVTAFGDDGPYAERGGIDPIAQAMSGMMSVTGPKNGPPMRSGVTVVDFGAGLMLASAVLAALVSRERTGRGRAITTSLLDVGLLYTSSLFPLASATGSGPPRLENRSHPVLADQFATSDGFVIVAVWDERRWQELCSVLGCRQLSDDPGLQSNEDRLREYDRVRPVLQEALRCWSTQPLIGELTRRNVICAQTLNVAQVMEDQHIADSGALYCEPRLGAPLTMVGGASGSDGRRLQSSRPPPRLGEHTAEVLHELLGLTESEITALAGRGVIRREQLAQRGEGCSDQ